MFIYATEIYSDVCGNILRHFSANGSLVMLQIYFYELFLILKKILLLLYMSGDTAPAVISSEGAEFVLLFYVRVLPNASINS